MQTSTFYFKAVLETNPPSLFALHSLQKTFTFHSENSLTQNAMSKTLFLLDLLDSHKALQQPCLSPISQQSPRAAVTRGSYFYVCEVKSLLFKNQTRVVRTTFIQYRWTDIHTKNKSKISPGHTLAMNLVNGRLVMQAVVAVVLMMSLFPELIQFLLNFMNYLWC